MKKIIFLILVFVFPIIFWGQTFDVVALMENGSQESRINFVYMGDGYTSAEQTSFITNTQNALNAQFNTTPYKEYRNFFNAYAIKVISNESGTDHPIIQGNSNCNSVPQMVTDTYFNSTFDYANIHRLLVPTNGTAIYDVLSTNFPNYNQVNILVNTPYYGGSGGTFATSSVHTSANEIMIHEIGHSFAYLADEYWAGSNYASEKANMTQESNPTLIKWKNWLYDEGIGIYPYGTNPPESTWFRPHQNCKMQYLGVPFCAVCKEATIDHIYTLIPPIDSFVPVNNNVMFDGNDLDFSIELILPNPNTLAVEWFLDGDSFATDLTSITLTENEITENNHSLTVTVEDMTALSRTYIFANGYSFNITWNITDTSAEITENLVQQFIYKVYPNPAQNLLYFDYFANNIHNSFEIVITDLQGKKLKTKSITPYNGEHQVLLDINSLSSGVYIFYIQAEAYSKSFKFIKE